MVLMHRRSQQVTSPGKLCSPGGLIPRITRNCDALGFQQHALATALQMLENDTGVLPSIEGARSYDLPAGKGAFWGPAFHRNFSLVLTTYPRLLGPAGDVSRRLMIGGVDGIGKPAGDGVHAWVNIIELFERQDLMVGCRTPLASFLGSADGDSWPADGAASGSRYPGGAP